MKVYFEAVAVYDEQDVEAAVEAFLTGSAPGISNPSFAPPAPVVGSEVRRQMNLRVEHERRIAKPALPPPDIERTPESQARVRDLVARTAAGLSALSAGERDQSAEHRRQMFAETNARNDAARYTAGDPDAEADAA